MRLKRESRTAAAAPRRRTTPRRRWRDNATLRLLLAATPRLLLLAAIAGAALWTWRSGTAERLAADAEAAFWSTTVRAGLAVQDVTVSGRERSDPQRLLAALGVERGTPILAFDPHAARERVLALPWISAAEVERRLPDQIHLRLEERLPLALWQHEGRLQVIDQHGRPIANARPGRYVELPLVVGEGAAEQARALVALLGREPDLAERVVAAIWVSERRWNVQLEGGIDVRLPETGAAEAWSRLAQLDREQGLLERDVAMVDLRLPDRLVLRTATGQLPKPPSRGGTDT